MTDTSEFQYVISDATMRNWERLNTQTANRLTTRANKMKSRKRILPLEYISDNNNVLIIQKLLDYGENVV